ncbi:MAG: DEAD/DEAH box helicase [Clostridia bacterium]|nr:DEAD/DEAH box helicase [Clostridia bacterium]
MSFYKLGLSWEMVYALECQNILEPTIIQKLAIPPILNKKDVMAEAQTGTGKTLAFLLPLMDQIDLEMGLQAIVLAPTRELAIQITAEAKKLTEMKPVSILPVYGGQDFHAQLHKMNHQIHLIIATPGRLLDHLKRSSFSVDEMKILVVDEADQLFHIGFKDELKAIMKFFKKDYQIICVSATLSHRVNSFKDHYLKSPVHVVAPKEKMILDEITQEVIQTSNRKKYDDFKALLVNENIDKSIIFCRSRKGSEALGEAMKADQYSVEVLHGGLTQSKREALMEGFKNNEFKYLVATDVAARGLDIKGVDSVINYNLPDDPENYVHRIGRTGRAGQTGKSYILLTQKDYNRLHAVEAFMDHKLI